MERDVAQLSPLSMLLNGIIDAAVNGGTKIYTQLFLSPQYVVARPQVKRDKTKLAVFLVCFTFHFPKKKKKKKRMLNWCRALERCCLTKWKRFLVLCVFFFSDILIYFFFKRFLKVLRFIARLVQRR